MLNESEKARLVALTFRMERLRQLTNRERQFVEVLGWVIDDWQREKTQLESEDRL